MVRPFPAERQANAFTMLEVMVVLLIIGLLSSLALQPRGSSLTVFGKTLLVQIEKEQFQAAADRQSRFFELKTEYWHTKEQTAHFPAGVTCRPAYYRWNAKGNISQAGTIVCQKGNQTIKIVLQLGSGRGRLEKGK